MDLDEVHQRLQEHTEDLDAWNTVISWCTIKGRDDQTQSLRTTRISRISVLPGLQHFHLGSHFSWRKRFLLGRTENTAGLLTSRTGPGFIPDLRHARRIWIYRVILKIWFKNEEALWEVSIYQTHQCRSALLFQMEKLETSIVNNNIRSQSRWDR